MQGVITDSGRQVWSQSAGNSNFVYAMYNSGPIAEKTFSYKLEANVTGMKPVGYLRLELIGSVGGQPFTVSGGPIVGMIPGECFPSLTVPTPACASTDTGAIPVFFLVAGTVTSGGSSTPRLLVVELAFLNPFGGQTVIMSPDGSLVIVSTYKKAIVQWEGVQLGGTVTGTLGGQAVSGRFTETSNAKENLLQGTETEHGSIAFVGMSIPALDVNGMYGGTSTIPRSGIPCSSQLGLPPSTCLLTGFSSTGKFHMEGPQVNMKGTYEASWLTPAVAFVGQISASVHMTQQEGSPSSHGDDGSQKSDT